MKLRLMGTDSEINSFIWLLEGLQEDNFISIRSISGFYKNRPPSIEGRVYVEID